MRVPRMPDLSRLNDANSGRIAILPADWQDILRTQFLERRLALRNSSATAAPRVVTSTLDDALVDGETEEVVWDDAR